MRVKYAVTFEFDMAAPLTHRGTVVARHPATCCARAVREANSALRPRNWSSVVCVLLERLDASTEEDKEPLDDADGGEEADLGGREA